MEAIFGVATVWDLDELHTSVELHRKQDEIVHLMYQQVTSFKRLDGTARFKHQAIINLHHP